MSKPVRNFLLIAAMLIILGGIISGIGFALGGMAPISITPSGIKLFNEGGQQVLINEDYKELKSVEIDTDIMELKFKEGNSFKLEGNYNSNLIKLDISESNGKLSITSRSTQTGFFGWNWFNFGFGNFNVNELTLTYPKGTDFENITLNSNLGSLKVNGLSAATMKVKLDAGSFNGESIVAGDLDVDMNLGECNLNGLIAQNSAAFNLDAGSLTLKNSKLADSSIKLNLGGCDFSGSLSGNADISLSAGSLTLNLDNKEESVGYSIHTDLGSIHVNGRQLGSPASSKSANVQCNMNIKANLGSVTINTK